MELDSVSKREFASVCEESGIICRDVEKIRTRVFRATIQKPDSMPQEVYGKIYPSDKERRIREAVVDPTEIGLPGGTVVGGEFVILLMEPADGWPLSHVLPVALFPGLWKVWGDRFDFAYSQLGWYLGTQHTRTERGTVPLLDQTQVSKLRQQASLLTDVVHRSTRRRLETVIDEAQNRQTPCAVTHSDPSPHNIFYKSGEITLIDNSFSRKGAANDHANVRIGIWLMVGRLPYVRRRSGNRLEDAYWQGYQSRGIEASTDRIDVAILSLKKYLSLFNYYRSEPDILHARITRYTDKEAIINGIQREIEYLTDVGFCE